MQDYAVLYFGTVAFKIGRLVAIAALCIHCFACAFYRVKIESASSPDDVEQFYVSRGVAITVHPHVELLVIWALSNKSFVLSGPSKSVCEQIDLLFEITNALL